MSTTDSTADTMKIRASNPKEIAMMYGVSTKTLRTWLGPHKIKLGERRGRYFTAKQVRIIIDVLGEPG